MDYILGLLCVHACVDVYVYMSIRCSSMFFICCVAAVHPHPAAHCDCSAVLCVYVHGVCRTHVCL